MEQDMIITLLTKMQEQTEQLLKITDAVYKVEICALIILAIVSVGLIIWQKR